MDNLNSSLCMQSDSVSHTQSRGGLGILHIHQRLVLQVRSMQQHKCLQTWPRLWLLGHGVGNKKSHCSSVSPAQQGILTESIHPATVQALLRTQKARHINQHRSAASTYFARHRLLKSSSYFSPTLNRSHTHCFIQVKTFVFTPGQGLH